MITERRQAPRDDLISALLEAELDDDGDARTLDDLEVVSFVVLLAGAGVETVARLLSWAAVVLARNPDQRALLADDPTLIANGIEELLRYEAPSPVNGRWVTRAVRDARNDRSRRFEDPVAERQRQPRPARVRRSRTLRRAARR